MKTRILLVITVLAAAAFNAVGQGYFLFTANKNSVYPNQNITAAFLWGPAGQTNALGSIGVPTSCIPPPDFQNMWLAALNDPAWHWGTNLTANAFAAVNVNPSGLAIGGINYNSGAPFTVAGTVGGQTYTIYCIAWYSIFSDPRQSFYVGWSTPFLYTAGNGPTSTPLGFSSSGMQPFGVGIPEPTTFALAGLGAAVLMFTRRIRLKFRNCLRPSD